jgi:hypothetical protein
MGGSCRLWWLKAKLSFEKKIIIHNLATSIELKTTGIDKASIPKQATIKKHCTFALQQAPKWRADEINLDIKLYRYCNRFT